MNNNSIQELVNIAAERGCKISEVVLEDQSEQLECDKSILMQNMLKNLSVMKEAAQLGIASNIKSESGLAGGDAYKMGQASKNAKVLGDSLLNSTLSRALAVAEVNACMGKIVAAPTAGSCGIIPAVLLSVGEKVGSSEEDLAMALFTAGGIGTVIAGRASVSGAEGGCQSECGSASAMAAAVAVELAGGTPQMAANACAIAMKSVLGLVCDPVAGLVEVPCIKRNATGAVNALAAASMALAGIESAIPADEVIDAMKSIGSLMPACLKETAEGGLAITPTGCRLAKKVAL